MRAEITQEKYEKYKKQGLTDVIISKRWGIQPSSLTYHKKKWYGGGKGK